MPHVVWLAIWMAATLFVVVFQWLWLIGSGRMEDDVHRYVARLVRHHVHVSAYVLLLADPWPRVSGREGYPLDLTLDPPERQPRLTVAFRIVLALPAFVFAFALRVIVLVVAVLGWFASLALGRMPQGLRDLGAYCLRFEAQTWAYLLLLTPRYPSLAA